MFENQLFNGILGKGFDLLGGSDTQNAAKKSVMRKLKHFC